MNTQEVVTSLHPCRVGADILQISNVSRMQSVPFDLRETLVNPAAPLQVIVVPMLPFAQKVTCLQINQYITHNTAMCHLLRDCRVSMH
jgi:hypothetical protein